MQLTTPAAIIFLVRLSSAVPIAPRSPSFWDDVANAFKPITQPIVNGVYKPIADEINKVTHPSVPPDVQNLIDTTKNTGAALSDAAQNTANELNELARSAGINIPGVLQAADDSLDNVISQPWGPNMKGSQKNWMASIPDSVNLAQISMPGTHDTMTYAVNSLTGAGYVRCQNADLDTQYNSGIRFVDIRCHIDGTQFTITHANFPTGKTFTDVIKSTGQFLDANPKECIIMRVKSENNNDNGNVAGFFDNYKNSNPDTKDIFTKHHYTGYLPKPSDDPFPLLKLPLNNFWNDAGYNFQWPNLGDCRGKFIVLADYNDQSKAEMLYDSSTSNSGPPMRIADDYSVKSLDSKWSGCDQNLNSAQMEADNQNGGTRMFVTYISGSLGIQDVSGSEIFSIGVESLLPPKAIALGTGSSKGMNERAYEKLKSWGGKGRAGVVMMDFGGQDLIDTIIGLNKF